MPGTARGSSVGNDHGTREAARSLTLAGDVGRTTGSEAKLVKGLFSLKGVDVLLSDGSTARVRVIRPSDAQAVVEFHGRLSPETIWLRYFTPHPHLSEAEVAQLVRSDDPDHVALVVERDGRIIAIAQYEREPGKDEAEVAFVIEDAFQGRGIGTTLLGHLASIARQHGIKIFVADTLSVNTQMLQVFRNAGFVRHSRHSGDGIVRVVLDIAPTEQARQAADARDAHAIVASMERLLRPRAVAVIGAARERGKIGHELLTNIVKSGFTGPVYPVNPNARAVASLPSWPSIQAVPEKVDLAVISVPAAMVLEEVRACGEAGVGALVIVTAGFAEMGPKGKEMQDEIVGLAHDYGMRVVGPNCFGLLNTDPAYSLNATFAPDQALLGRVGFVSQSGGLGIAILAEARERGLGLSSFVSMGNKADVSGNDLLIWWENDPNTDVALMYLESFGNPRRFARLARRISKAKPIVVVKSGRSSAGMRAASSHTAALATQDRVVDAVLEQTGVIRVESIEELFDLSEFLGNQPLPVGKRVGILTNSGGPGVLAADACAGHGLEVPALSEELKGKLAKADPGFAALGNPVDLGAGASAKAYEECLKALMASGEVDAVMVVFTPPIVTRADEVMTAVKSAVDWAVAKGHDIPVTASMLGTPKGQSLVRSDGKRIPLLTYPENAARVIGRAVEYSNWRKRPEGSFLSREGIDINGARALLESSKDEDGWVLGSAALSVLSCYGIPVVRTEQVASPKEAAQAAESIGCPVALKIMGHGIVHKSDIGGVALGLQSPEEAAKAYRRMRARVGESMTGAVVQPMAPEGVETIVGFLQDPSFGPQVLFGLGGTAVELLGDSMLRLAPLSDLDAWDMVHGLKGSPLLTGGYRGAKPVDTKALAELLQRVGALAEDLPEVLEMDANPVTARPDGVLVLDARLRVGA
jgi:acetyl coenzyme A synthetase (ADP forming)-like protein